MLKQKCHSFTQVCQSSINLSPATSFLRENPEGSTGICHILVSSVSIEFILLWQRAKLSNVRFNLPSTAFSI